MDNKNLSSVTPIKKGWLIVYLIFSIALQGVIAVGFAFGSFGTSFAGVGIDYFDVIKIIFENVENAEESEMFYIMEYFAFLIGYLILTVISVARFIGACASVGKSLKEGECCDDRFYSSPKHLTSAYLVLIILSAGMGFYGFNEITVNTAYSRNGKRRYEFVFANRYGKSKR